MTDKKIVFYAVRTSGKFMRGQTYTREQLGILGRMAVRAGFLAPVEEAARRVKTGPERAVRPRSVNRAKRKGAGGGEAAVQAGSGPDLRDDSGTQGSQVVHGGDQPESQA